MCKVKFRRNQLNRIEYKGKQLKNKRQLKNKLQILVIHQLGHLRNLINKIAMTVNAIQLN